jgi:hypothetical protein
MTDERTDLGPPRWVVAWLVVVGLIVVAACGFVAWRAQSAADLAKGNIRILRAVQQSEMQRQRLADASNNQRLCIARAQAEGLAAAVSVVLQPPGSLGRVYATVRLNLAGDALNDLDKVCPLVGVATVPNEPTTTTVPAKGGGVTSPTVPFTRR